MRNNFLEGMRRGINLFPSDREAELTIPSHSDAEAFQDDLKQVAKDMYSAIELLSEHSPKKSSHQ